GYDVFRTTHATRTGSVAPRARGDGGVLAHRARAPRRDPPRGGPSTLAARAVEGRAPAADPADHGTARAAGLPVSSVDRELELERAGVLVDADVVAQRRAAGGDRRLEHRAHAGDEAGALGARQRAGPAA